MIAANPWTGAEDTHVREHFPDGGAAACVPHLPGRTEAAITQRWYKIRNLPAAAAAEPDLQLPAIATAPVVDFTVIATRPSEMQDAQRQMCDWAAQKIAAVEIELAEAQQSYEAAMRAGWDARAFERAVNRIDRLLGYYRKLKAALDAGYYIVPPFPLDIFTIRTRRASPDRKTSTYRWDRRTQEAQILPPGEGRYVSDEPEIHQRTIPAADAGEKKDVTEYFAQEFRDFVFPFALAKPRVVEATAAAMALRVFDRLGALPQSRASADPIICGEILHPVSRRPVTFFVAWWLDARTL